MALPVCKLPRLPRNPQDATDVCDRYGNRWKFSDNDETWVSHGVLQPPLTVTESNDGVITPEIVDRLVKLRNIFNDINLDPIKIAPGTDAYWYYFHSSDKFIRFTPEDEDTLRLEVDRGRLYQVLMKQVCPGPRGDKGKQGARGDRGISGPAEALFEPSVVSGDRIDFAIYTPTPLLGDRSDIVLPNNHVPDISIRLFAVDGLPASIATQTVQSTKQKKKRTQSQQAATAYDQLQYFAVQYHDLDIDPKFHRTRDLLMRQSMGTTDALVCDIALSRVLLLPTGAAVAATPLVTILIDPLGSTSARVITDDERVDVQRTAASIKFDSDTNIACGSIYLINTVWVGDWCLKSRQRGPDGPPGEPGSADMVVIERTLDTSNVFATCPFVAARYDAEQSTIFTTCSDIANNICVDTVRILRDAGALNDLSAMKSTFASVQVILDDCKFIHRYSVVLADDEIGDPDFAHWDPQPGCVSKRNYDRHNFNWMANTDSPACDPAVIWYDSILAARGGKYPWPIVKGKSPIKDACCSEDFFYCPNVQDTGCSHTNNVDTNPPPGPPPPPPPVLIESIQSVRDVSAKLDLQAFTGDTFLKTVTWDDDGTIVDTTDYYGVMTVKDVTGATVAELTTLNGGIMLGGKLGKITLFIPAKGTSGLQGGTHQYTLVLTSPNGVTTTLLTGNFVVK